ncbi:MAG: HAMP domain-containing sensor histidine kinase, partial [Bacillota bacterium]|nr:HAMP domain-containing sensor histidine kinase [Bacillota bacterium]
NDLVLRVANSLQPLAKAKGIEIHVSCENKLEIKGDEGKLYRAVLNIMDNAIKFAASSVHVSCQGNGAIHLSISDDGPGVPLESQGRIFERFYRVDKARTRVTGGSGLGLAIAYEIVSMHDGSLKVNSLSGHGAEFVIMFPLSNLIES